MLKDFFVAVSTNSTNLFSIELLPMILRRHYITCTKTYNIDITALILDVIWKILYYLVYVCVYFTCIYLIFYHEHEPFF